MPLWMALPPEVHSSLLSQGPGPGPLIAAAAAWQSLADEYTAAADEVSALIAETRSACWEGSAADSWVAAHAPFVAWLRRASADSLAAAARHAVSAAAYSAALSAMPTLAELAANRATHTALVVTNFFGINTIPIAVNESDYLRMWIQAATTMSAYEASSATAIAATPAAVPPPQVLKTTGMGQAQSAASLDPGRMLLNALEPILNSFGINPLIRNPLVSNVVTTFIADFLEHFGVYWDPGAGMLNGLDYEYYADATQPMWYLARGLELIGDSMQMTQNPTQAMQYMLALAIFDWPTHIAQLGSAITQSPMLVAAAGGAMVLPAAQASGLAGLAGLAAPPQPLVAAEPSAEPAPANAWPASGMSPSTATVAAAPTGAPAPAPASSAAPASAGTVPPAPPAAGTGFVPPYALGPPGIGFGSGMSASASAGAKKKAPEPDSAPAVAQSRAAIRRQARARARTTQRQHGHKFMDMGVEVDPDWEEPTVTDAPTASHRGAEDLGTAGVVSNDSVTQAAGLARMRDDFGSGPTTPMVPRSWR